ncbi:MAG: histidine triad nucleotide-binding protein [Gammaproteobacteria bacterium]|jgi:histidine triad (HIT) family protein
MSDDCIFCKIAAGDVPVDLVHEDEHVMVFHDIQPVADTHLLVIPRTHIESLEHLSSEHDALSAHMLRLLPELAQRMGLSEGFRTIINTGVGGGQTVFHLHIHLLGGERLPGFH